MVNFLKGEVFVSWFPTVIKLVEGNTCLIIKESAGIEPSSSEMLELPLVLLDEYDDIST
jgi:hypothetical protein